MNSKKIAEKLLQLRKKKHVTREMAANDLGISVSALTMYELGKRIPRDETKIAIAQYYGTSVELIFFN